MTLQEIEKIDLELQEANDEHDQNDSETEESENIIEKADDGELLVIWRALHAEISPRERAKGEHLPHPLYY
ncbi:hypothetical protein NL676_034845 [Syzygium grande]|nr:hypothetical protein NL676_034845 [Syzygium grande]